MWRSPATSSPSRGKANKPRLLGLCRNSVQGAQRQQWSVKIYYFFKDFAGPMATAFAAFAAVSVTLYFNRHQKRIAEEQKRIAEEQKRIAEEQAHTAREK
jgi:hypothetical protein